jgi:hypothetical protein
MRRNFTQGRSVSVVGVTDLKELLGATVARERVAVHLALVVPASLYCRPGGLETFDRIEFRPLGEQLIHPLRSLTFVCESVLSTQKAPCTKRGSDVHGACNVLRRYLPPL